MRASPKLRVVSLHRPGGTLAGLFGVGAILIALALQVLNNTNAAVSLSIVVVLLAGFTSAWRFKKHGIDPLALFCFCFVFYDGVLLFRLATVSNSSVLLYPSSFTTETYAIAGALCVLAVGTVFLTALAWESTIAPFLKHCKSPQETADRGTWFWSGLCAYAFGVGLYFLQFGQEGGYFAALVMGRGDRFELDATGLSYPYLAFVVPGIASMCYGSEVRKSNAERVICYGLVAVWCTLVLLQGDRRLVLQAIFTVIAVLSVLRPAALKLKVQTWILIVVAYFLFSIFAYARPLIAAVAASRETPAGAVSELIDSWSTDWILPEHTELAGPYLSLLSAVSSSTEHLYGSSYYESLPAVLPKFLYPGQKPPILSSEFASQMHRGIGPASGWGYSPVAEAFVNFGVAGVVLIFVLWTIFFLVVGEMRYRSASGIIAFAVLFSEAVNANRIDFRNVYGEIVYFIVGLLTVTCINAILAGLVGGLLSRKIPSPELRTLGRASVLATQL